MGYVSHLVQPASHQTKVRPLGFFDHIKSIPEKLVTYLQKVKHIGVTPGMNRYEKSKLVIFNYLNFFQVITGLLVPLIGFFYVEKLPAIAWIIASLPAFISIAVLILNAKRYYRKALLTYFVLYPFFVCLSYINGINLGVELSFVLYGILSVFFIRDIGYMLFSISFSMISYFILSVIWKKYPYQLEHINVVIYLINQGLAIVYIFFGLYLIKRENNNYNAALQQTNLEIQKQSDQLLQQSEELQQLNSLKNKLFSIISHDLKAPMYALRNMFDNMQSQNMPAEEIKSLVPDMQKDLNYTVSLMENLLQWAKSQMQLHTASPQQIDVNEVISDVTNLMKLQADVKKIKIETKTPENVYGWADADMINVVLRNLISNAIKFSPQNSTIFIEAKETPSAIQIDVKDTGEGINAENLQKINARSFYTTNGTAQEQGTGLGLLLCRDFLAKNGGQLHIASVPGKGSVFSFTIPYKN